MKFYQALVILLASSASDAFVVRQQEGSRFATKVAMTTNDSQVELGLTPELKKITDAFSGIPDEQVRYKQLLYMAQNNKEANNMPASSKIPENKVPGCLSTVYVDGTATYSEEVGDYVIDFIGDSDGLLTRGLVALLLRGLSGNTAEAIQKVDPQFIKAAGIEQSLTPGRNNGFLNMLKVMKRKAADLDAAAREKGDAGKTRSTDSAGKAAEAPAAVEPDNGQGPKYNAIVNALQMLKPTYLNLVDNSDQHAGHAGNDMDGESHFDLEIVSDAFEGLSLVKRHKLIYMVLGEMMPQIHALQIRSLTPAEAEKTKGN